MKKSAKNSYVRIPVYIFLVVVFLFSCEKSQEIQKFDDVFDISGVSALNQKFVNANTVNDLSDLKEYSGIELPRMLKDMSIEALVTHYEENIKLTSNEIDMLLKNDSETYLKVINRFGSFPSGFKNTEADFNRFKSTALGKYSVRQKSETENFYSDDYYSAILAYQDYIKSSVINPIKNAKILSGKGYKFANGNEPLDPSDDPNILGYKLIVINNNWVMWWTYYVDGTRTKHKGSTLDTTYPGF